LDIRCKQWRPAAVSETAAFRVLVSFLNSHSANRYNRLGTAAKFTAYRFPCGVDSWRRPDSPAKPNSKNERKRKKVSSHLGGLQSMWSHELSPVIWDGIGCN
jgi:hypothetical protein